MKVFIDTSAYVALLVEIEADHTRIAKKYYNYRQEHAILFTSDYILDELFTHLTFFKQTDIKKVILKLKESISKGEITVLRIVRLYLKKAWRHS